jgi:hypothetical protein
LGLGVCLGLYFTGLNTPGPLPWYLGSPGAGTIGMIVSLVLPPIISIPVLYRKQVI